MKCQRAKGEAEAWISKTGVLSKVRGNSINLDDLSETVPFQGRERLHFLRAVKRASEQRGGIVILTEPEVTKSVRRIISSSNKGAQIGFTTKEEAFHELGENLTMRRS